VSALINAFPTRGALAQMLRFRLDRSLDEIAGPGNLRDTVFEVVTHAEAHGRGSWGRTWGVEQTPAACRGQALPAS
jgi:hypothetical protein